MIVKKPAGTMVNKWLRAKENRDAKVYLEGMIEMGESYSININGKYVIYQYAI
ncbi:hypothetical protein QQ020_02075 [Fulvivirgaceae bacterium BMA12]|uniref:Uncharacterized protein n=1 Tax=Agaribacillus aureus TaxID=3051825 RepID=A0ABT8KZE7_9BACT|nr:hypothetical protein [Fulvivirgaceae bacterium BMA12]